MVKYMMKIPFSPPDIGEGEINEVIEALRSGWITTGPKTKLLEKQISEYCNTSTSVCLNSATAALELTLRILGIGEGDEVITSAYTYTASASVICHVGATPVLVDIQKDSFEMDYEKLASAINEKTKAVIPVDLAGVVCDYDSIFRAVESKKELFTAKNDIQKAIGRVAVITDAAHGFGARKDGKMCGEFSDFTCFSFHAVKNLTTAEGGAVTFKDIKGVDSEELYKQYQLLSLHGQNKDALAKTKVGAWEYDIVAPYYKCNMTDIAAALGLAQMRRYEDMLKRRHEIIAMYDSALSEIGATAIKHSAENFRSSGHLYIMRLDGFTLEMRNDFITAMAEEGISTNVHYKPLPLLTAYSNLGFDIKDFPEAYNHYVNEVTLPLHTCLSDEEVKYVIDGAVKCAKKIRGK